MISKNGKKPKVAQTTQRVDLDTLNRIKIIDLHLNKRGVRLTQSDIIARSLSFAMAKESEFIEYVCSGELGQSESTFDMIVNLTGKPWFPYGNLV